MKSALLDQIGGEEGVARLVTRFYDLMEHRPEAHDIHRLHFRGHGLAHTREQQRDFMIGFMGGRQHYRETHGHMDVREIHAHVPIREDDAETWLNIWDMALADCGHSGPHVERLRQTVRRVALETVSPCPSHSAGRHR